MNRNREGLGSPSQELTKPFSLPGHDTGLFAEDATYHPQRHPQKQGLVCIGHRSIWPRCGVGVFRLLLTRAILYFIERSSKVASVKHGLESRKPKRPVCYSNTTAESIQRMLHGHDARKVIRAEFCRNFYHFLVWRAKFERDKFHAMIATIVLIQAQFRAFVGAFRLQKWRRRQTHWRTTVTGRFSYTTNLYTCMCLGYTTGRQRISASKVVETAAACFVVLDS